jgi:hypothetical protein
MDQQQPFYLFFGLFGLVLGGATVWFLMANHPFEDKEPPPGPVDALEAGFLAQQMTERGQPMDEETVAQLLDLHTAYLEGRPAEEPSPRIEVKRTTQPEG